MKQATDPNRSSPDAVSPLVEPARGWPWDENLPNPPAGLAVDPTRPRISLVTPSYNQGAFIEETLRSVLLQRYPNLEYIIMDGGSTDNSREIIQRYAPYLAHWCSEKDNGQSDAISRGFALSTGDILGWVNSDDLLLPGCLLNVANYFVRHPEVDCVVGGTLVIDQFGKTSRNPFGLPRIVKGGRETIGALLGRRGCSFMQPASFWRREAYLAAGGLDSTLRYAMDYDLYLRLAERKPFGHLDEMLACFRVHPSSKTAVLQSVYRAERNMLLQRHGVCDNTLRSSLYRAYLAVRNTARNLPDRIAFALGIANTPLITRRGGHS